MLKFAIVAVLMLSATPVLAKADCDDWPFGKEFFETATVADVRSCIDAGADVHARNEDGKTLFQAVRYPEEGVPLSWVSPMVRVILAAIDCENWLEEEFFKTSTVANVRSCISAGAGVNLQGAHNVTPLHLAARLSENPAVIAVLIEAGADVNADSVGGFTSLHYAAENKNLAVTKILLAAGANAGARGSSLALYEASTTPIHWAASSNENPAVIVALIEAGVEVNGPDSFGETALHRAAHGNNSPAVIEALLTAGADVDARARWRHAAS